MLIKIFLILAFISFLCGGFLGNEKDLISSFFSGGSDSVTYCLKICGGICFFSGCMKVAEAVGVINKTGELLRPFVSAVLPSAKINRETENYAVMNIASNFFGLGNAATPFGIKAARNMYLLNNMNAPDRSFASFIVLNTSSLCFVPVNLITLRRAYGSQDPASVLLPIIIVQLVSCAVGLLAVRAVFRK